MIYGYARCSTNENLQDIERQVRELKQQGATDETIYKEYESGTKTNRAELDIYHKVFDALSNYQTKMNAPKN